jgi:hypothetical protein
MRTVPECAFSYMPRRRARATLFMGPSDGPKEMAP